MRLVCALCVMGLWGSGLAAAQAPRLLDPPPATEEQFALDELCRLRAAEIAYITGVGYPSYRLEHLAAGPQDIVDVSWGGRRGGYLFTDDPAYTARPLDATSGLRTFQMDKFGALHVRTGDGETALGTVLWSCADGAITQDAEQLAAEVVHSLSIVQGHYRERFGRYAQHWELAQTRELWGLGREQWAPDLPGYEFSVQADPAGFLVEVTLPLSSPRYTAIRTRVPGVVEAVRRDETVAVLELPRHSAGLHLAAYKAMENERQIGRAHV